MEKEKRNAIRDIVGRTPAQIYPDIDLSQQAVIGGFSPSKPHPVLIERVDNGYVIKVGCKTLVCQSLKDTMDGVKSYFENPKEAEKKYLKEKK